MTLNVRGIPRVQVHDIKTIVFKYSLTLLVVIEKMCGLILIFYWLYLLGIPMNSDNFIDISYTVKLEQNETII